MWSQAIAQSQKSLNWTEQTKCSYMISGNRTIVEITQVNRTDQVFTYDLRQSHNRRNHSSEQNRPSVHIWSLSTAAIGQNWISYFYFSGNTNVAFHVVIEELWFGVDIRIELHTIAWREHCSTSAISCNHKCRWSPAIAEQFIDNSTFVYNYKWNRLNLQHGPVSFEGVQPEPSIQLKIPCFPKPETFQKGTRDKRF